MDFTNLGLILITSMTLSMLFMPVVLKLAPVLNAIDIPDARKVHTASVPSLGGLAFSIAFVLTCLLFIPIDSDLRSFLLGLGIIILTGIADDLWDISSLAKFAGQIAACLVFIISSGAAIDSFGDLFGAGSIGTGILAVPLTLFCMVGVINALNLSDGLDGLAGGLSVIASLFLAYFAIISGYWLALFLLTALVGSLIGFLFHNVHPAHIFMGDTGSLVLGYSLSAICILFLNIDDMTMIAPISLALIVGLPIHDTFFVITSRVMHGISPLKADNNHLHHRLMSLGLSHPAVVAMMYIIMMSYGFLALIMFSLSEWQQFSIGVAYGIILFASVVVLQRIGFTIPKQWQIKKRGFHKTEFYVHMAGLMGKSTSKMIWLLPLSLSIPILFFPSIQTGFMRTAFILGTLMIVLFPWKTNSDRSGWVHGLIYIATFILLVILNFIGPLWTSDYLKIIASLVLFWVILKFIFNRRNVRAHMTSSFELLMLTISWFIPVVLMTALDFSYEKREQLIFACLEAIPFLLAIKFIAHREPKRNRSLVICLSGLFFMIGIRQLYAVLH